MANGNSTNSMVNTTIFNDTNWKKVMQRDVFDNGTFASQPASSLWTDPGFAIPVAMFLVTAFAVLAMYLWENCRDEKTTNNEVPLEAVITTDKPTTPPTPQLGSECFSGQVFQPGSSIQEQRLEPEQSTTFSTFGPNAVVKTMVNQSIEEIPEQLSSQDTPSAAPQSSSFDQEQADFKIYSKKFLWERGPDEPKVFEENSSDESVVEICNQEVCQVCQNVACHRSNRGRADFSIKAKSLSPELKEGIKSIQIILSSERFDSAF